MHSARRASCELLVAARATQCVDSGGRKAVRLAGTPPATRIAVVDCKRSRTCSCGLKPLVFWWIIDDLRVCILFCVSVSGDLITFVDR